MEAKKGKIKAICLSDKRGTAKHSCESAVIREGFGIEGDAHGGSWHRQISMLSYETAQEFKRKGANITFGSFGENLVIEGINPHALDVGTRLHLGDEAIVEITQIGKECHSHCEIFKIMHDCIMPREGVFAEVIKGGRIKTGDEVYAEPDKNAALTAAVIALSDKGFTGERSDESGPLIKKMLGEAGYRVVEYVLLPDNKERLKNELIRLSDGRQVCLIVTTGGTGFSERDITPEATAEVCDRMARGIAEAIRAYSMTITKRAMLSRAEAGIRGKTLIVNLPGSPKAVREALEFILPELKHGIAVLRNKVKECGGK